MWKKSLNQKFLVLATMFAMVFSLVGAEVVQAKDKDGKPIIGITWKSNTQNYANFKKVIEAAGGIPVELRQVTSKDLAYDADNKVAPQDLETNGMLTLKSAKKIKAKKFDHTNVEEVLKDIDGVFFTGGEDISPTLFKKPAKAENAGETINATRDVSDYTLMAYCIDKNIPTFAVCRGEQMMGIVSGVTFIQHIPDYYAQKNVVYADLHRMPVGAPNRTYARHNVELTRKNSHLYDIVGSMGIANVSSWHHQAIESLKGTDLIETAKTNDRGVDIIEGIENPHKDFCVAVQFHPENDCQFAIAQNKPEKALCNLDVCLNFFKELVKYAKKDR